MAEDKARDILVFLDPRPRLGERLLERVGRRGWGRPDVACSARIFHLYRLADPWDPTLPPDDPVKLGPVSLRLNDDRRQPAPHLKPKKQSSKRADEVDPVAKWRRPKRPRTPNPTPSPPPASNEPKPTNPMESKQPLRGRLPVRPDLEQVAGTPPGHSTPAVGKPLPDADGAPAQRNVRKAHGRGSKGRFSLQSTATHSPVIRKIDNEPKVAPPDPEPDAQPVAPPVPRSLPGAGGLDDLFSGTVEMGRLKIPPRADNKDE